MSLKVFGKSAFVYSIGTIAARISTFILIPIYTHYLAIDTYGLLSILLLAIQVIGTIIDFGLLKSLMRFVPEYNKINKSGELIGSAIVLNVISGFFVALIILFFSTYMTKNTIPINNYVQIVILILVASFTQSLSLNLISYFRAQNDVKWYTILSVLTALLTLIGGYYFIVIAKLDLVGAIIDYIVSYTIIIIFTLIKLSTNHKFSYKNATFFKLAKYGFPLIFARSGDLIASLFAMSFLSAFVNLQVVAVYNLANKIAIIMSLVLVLPFQLALEPYVFNNIEDKKLKENLSRIATYLVLAFLTISYILIYLSPLLVRLLAPPDYGNAYYIIIFILPIYLFQSFGYFGQSLLHINKKSITTGTIIFIMTLISIPAGYILIKYFGLPGLIINHNINYFVTAALLFSFGRKEFFINIEFRKISILIIYFIILISLLVLFKTKGLMLPLYAIAPILIVFTVVFFIKIKIFEQQEINIFKSVITNIYNKVF